MNRMKKMLCLLLAAMLLAGVLSACGPSKEEILQALDGSWVAVRPDTEEQALKLLENIDLYEEEIALADLTTLKDAKLVSFTYSGEYGFAYDAEAMWQYVRSFYAQTFDILFENRAALKGVYEEAVEEMDREQFELFYAGLYSYSDFELLLDYFADIAYKYESLAEPFDIGTFRIDGDRLMMVVAGETEEEYVTYELEGDTLTLTYADSVEVYTRKK